MNRRWQLGVGLLLTGMAGYVDALGFVRLGGLYTSFMSGNTTQLAVLGAQVELHRMILPAILILAFLTGSVLGSGLAILVPPRWTTPAVLAYESLLILAGLGLGLQSPELGLAAFFVAVAMGSQNAVLAQVKGFRAGTTFVTGALFSLGQKIAQALTRTGDPPRLARRRLRLDLAAVRRLSGRARLPAGRPVRADRPGGDLGRAGVDYRVPGLAHRAAGREGPPDMSSPVSNPSLTSHVAALEPGEHVLAAHFLKDVPALALSDGTVALVRADGIARVAAHPDSGILVTAGGVDRLVTGGDDGRVVAIRADGGWSSSASPRAVPGSTRWRSIPTVAWRGRPAAPSWPGTPRAARRPSRRRPPRAASSSRPRGTGWVSPTTTA